MIDTLYGFGPKIHNAMHAALSQIISPNTNLQTMEVVLGGMHALIQVSVKKVEYVRMYFY